MPVFLLSFYFNCKVLDPELTLGQTMINNLLWTMSPTTSDLVSDRYFIPFGACRCPTCQKHRHARLQWPHSRANCFQCSGVKTMAFHTLCLCKQANRSGQQRIRGAEPELVPVNKQSKFLNLKRQQMCLKRQIRKLETAVEKKKQKKQTNHFWPQTHEASSQFPFNFNV